MIWFAHQFALDGIVVHVAEFFCLLAFRPDVEVVETALPEMVILHGRKIPKAALCGLAGHVGAADNPSSKTLFQDLHHDGWISLVRFADQEMEVLGHDYISQNHETIALTHLLEDRQEEIAATCTGQVLSPVITTAGDEVQVPGTGIAFEIPGHDESVTLEWSLISVTTDFETTTSSQTGTLHVTN